MKKTYDKQRQNNHFGKDDVKHSSSIIYTQMGLVLALFLAYLAIESKTLVKVDPSIGITRVIGDLEDDIPDTTPEKLFPKKTQIPVETPPILDDIDIRKDDDKVEEAAIDASVLDPEIVTKTQLPNVPEVVIIEDDSDDSEILISLVDEAPIFPGCSGTTEEIKRCFSRKVNRLITRKFNADLIQDLGLAPGKKRIAVQFTVDKQGNVSNLSVRAPHKRLEKEAKRVVRLLPKMEPGKENGRTVSVKYTLPITLEVL